MTPDELKEKAKELGIRVIAGEDSGEGATAQLGRLLEALIGKTVVVDIQREVPRKSHEESAARVEKLMAGIMEAEKFARESDIPDSEKDRICEVYSLARKLTQLLPKCEFHVGVWTLVNNLISILSMGSTAIRQACIAMKQIFYDRIGDCDCPACTAARKELEEHDKS